MKYILSFLLISVTCSFMPGAGVNLFASVNERCSDNRARSWWDVQEYDLHITFDPDNKMLFGKCRLTAQVTNDALDSLQLDLDEPMQMDSVLILGEKKHILKRGNAYYVKGDFSSLKKGQTFTADIYYNGSPHKAQQAPWDGGIVWSNDANGNPWVGMACQGPGSSIWFPCKNFQSDEPARVVMHFTVPVHLKAIGNGRLVSVQASQDSTLHTWTWLVRQPINNYNITFYIGDYRHWSDTFQGKEGKLSLDYYVLPNNLAHAQKHFRVVKPMLQCFEDKIGPYPFYTDGYKLVEAPYLGMEHQSAVAYGNQYQMGYQGKDRSGTGVGMLFDFIIIHESGHEWFGNSITAFDKADSWIHEGFTTYTETIFAECLLGKDSAFAYQRGKRKLILNDRPVQGRFGQCDEGSGDHYDKAGYMIHMIRVIVDNDTLFFDMLKEMNRQFYHKIVTGSEIEKFINRKSGMDFSRLFEQYLRNKDLPELTLKQQEGAVYYKWEKCVPGFDIPVLLLSGDKKLWIKPTDEWHVLNVTSPGKPIRVSPDFLINTQYL